jgi:multimeric flavodoxin WrbA
MKTLLINGSPNKNGSTFTALKFIEDSLGEEGVEAEIYQIPKEPIAGCVACYACKSSGSGRCAVTNDAVNIILEKIENADALVIGSPVYYAAPNGHLISALDRVFFAGSVAGLFQGKPAAAVCAVRRGGATATLEVLQKYFVISGMPIAPATYWPMIHGVNADEVVFDKEGVQAMQMLGKTIAWMLKCFDAGRSAGIKYPAAPGGKKIMTNFIR